jgi:hypothetical protein
MIPRGSESRGGTPITLIAVHTSEGATTTASLASYLDQPGVEASYHVLVDDNGAYRYLPDEPAAWAMLSGNHRSVQVCLTGFARWPRSEWLAHDNMLRAAADVVRTWCTTYNIPNVKLTPAQVGGDHHGICGHWDWTLGKHDGTHTDPGPFFPWDVFIQYVNLDNPVQTLRRENDVQNFRVQGTGILPLICPTGKPSAITAQAWVSAAVDGPGPGHVRFWFQDDTHGLADVARDIAFADGHSARQWVQVPDGTTMIRVEHTFTAGGTVCLETQGK